MRLEFLVIIIAAVILGFLLMVRPIIGIADNGDFPRIMGSTGLGYLTPNNPDNYFGFINRLYSVNDIPLRLAGYYISTEIFLVKFAILLNRIAADNGIFDIRFLSFVYSGILLFSVYLILKYNKHKSAYVNWLLAVLIVVAFTDVGYISYFNSLYGEAVSFSFLFLTTAAALYLVKKDVPSIWALAGFFTASLFLIGAKVQNVPIVVIIALFGLRLRQIRKDKAWRYALIVFTGLLIISSTAIFLSTPKGIKNCNKYQAVFYGILKDSPNPSKDLQELGLDPKFASLSGTNFFMKDLPYDLKSPDMEKELYDKIKRSKIFLFYAKHPLRYLKKLERTAQSAFSIRQEGFGNFEKSESTKFGQMSESFGIWSSIKKVVIPRSLMFVIIFYILYYRVLISHHIKARDLREKSYVEIFMLIGLIGLIQFVIPILGDGEADLSKHLFLFNFCFDIMFVLSLTWLIGKSVSVGKMLYNSRTV